MDSLGIIINNKAKNASAYPAYLEAFSKSDLQYSLYQIDPEQLDTTIQKALRQHSILLVGGGDGTIRSAAQHCAHSAHILGVLPLGTMNHFVKELKLPSNPKELVQAILKKRTETIDLGEVNGLVFINNSSIGFYPSFAKKRDRYTKFYNKWLSYIPSLLSTLQHHDTFNIQIKSATLNRCIKTSFLMISNNLYSYSFPLNIERKHFNKKELGIYFFKHGRVYLSKIIRYFILRKKSFELSSSKQPVEIHIIDRKTIMISLDGDTMPLDCPLKYKSLPKALKLLTSAT